MTAPVFATFGCRLNAYETQAMTDLTGQAGLENAVIVNTCAVTAEAVRQARQRIRKLRREHPKARLIVTGCAAQPEPQTFAAIPEGDPGLGNLEKVRAEAWGAHGGGPDLIGPPGRGVVAGGGGSRWRRARVREKTLRQWPCERPPWPKTDSV